MAGAVPVADRRGVAGVEERAGGRGGGADHAQDEGLGDVAGAFERGERADGFGVVERREVYFCGGSDDLRWMCVCMYVCMC